MAARTTEPSPSHQAVIDRFTAACQADERIVAAFLGGSYARGAADAYSDLDLYLITTDGTYEDFYDRREQFMRQLGEPVFLESFDLPNIIFYVFADGAEGELGLGREGDFHHLHGGPHRVLVDKTGILANAIFPWEKVDPTEQVETLRRQIYWFWHDLSHFITAMGRGQLYWAHGQIDVLRQICVNLARLRHDFSAAANGYEKVEKVLPIAQLAPLQATYCPLEQEAMRQAGLALVRFYQELARPLAEAHGIAYPERLERVTVGRLEVV
jgi:predicted nucleotidyltransferase